MNKMLLTKEVAELLRVSEEYVRELIRHRKLKAYKEGRRGGFRITMEEIKKYINRKHEEMERSRK
jgi:excisionase family DNA binding protein